MDYNIKYDDLVNNLGSFTQETERIIKNLKFAAQVFGVNLYNDKDITYGNIKYIYHKLANENPEGFSVALSESAKKKAQEISEANELLKNYIKFKNENPNFDLESFERNHGVIVNDEQEIINEEKTYEQVSKEHQDKLYEIEQIRQQLAILGERQGNAPTEEFELLKRRLEQSYKDLEVLAQEMENAYKRENISNKNNDNISLDKMYEDLIKDSFEGEFWTFEDGFKMPKPRLRLINETIDDYHKFLENYYDKAYKYYDMYKKVNQNNPLSELNKKIEDAEKKAQEAIKELSDFIEQNENLLPTDEFNKKRDELAKKQMDAFNEFNKLLNEKDHLEKENKSLAVRGPQEIMDPNKKDPKQQDQPRLPEGQVPLGLPDHIEREDDPQIEIEETGKNFDLEDYIERISGDYDYKKSDVKVYKFKDSKLSLGAQIKQIWINDKATSHLLDKPLKIFKLAIKHPIIYFTKKKAIKRYEEEAKERIDFMVEQVKNTPDWELEELIKQWNGNFKKENLNAKAQLVVEVIQDRIRQYTDKAVREKNLKISSLYNEISEKYNNGLEIKQRLSDPTLSDDERKKIENEYNNINNELCTMVIEIRNLLDSASNSYSSGLKGQEEDNIFALYQRTGGKRSSKKYSKDHMYVSGIFGRKLVEALNNGNGFDAADAFLGREKFKLDETKIGHSIKHNLGLKANQGVYEYDPIAEEYNYTPDTYLSDVIKTAVIVTGIVNVANNIKNAAAQEAQNEAVRQSFDKFYNDVQKSYGDIQNQIKDLAKAGKLASKQANQLVDQLARQQLTNFQNGCEVASAQGQAFLKGTSFYQSGGTTYGAADDKLHVLSEKFTKEYNSLKSGDIQGKLDFCKRVSSATEKFMKNSYPGSKGFNLLQLNQFYDKKYNGSFDTSAFDFWLKNLGHNNISGYNDIVSEIEKVAKSISVPDASKVQAAIGNLNTFTNLKGAITILGEAGVLAAVGDKSENLIRETMSNDEIREEIKEVVSNVKNDNLEEAKRRYEEAMKEWNELGPFERLKRKMNGEKPKEIDYIKEIMKEEELKEWRKNK